ncbi:transmembrane protein, putative [Medicago truncatula]|uniref:Transmembrane protein, putative n=1 Tax=Medicago truncatula TaxID=3880 RepID=G7JAL6_MEDTR|nr:transmembrane protein, putative [Medicago truncatula]
MEFNKDFKDNTMWKNNIPSSKIKAWKKTTQRTKKNDIFFAISCLVHPGCASIHMGVTAGKISLSLALWF